MTNIWTVDDERVQIGRQWDKHKYAKRYITPADS